MTLQNQIEKSFPTLEKLFGNSLDEFKHIRREDLPTYLFGLEIMFSLKHLGINNALYRAFMAEGITTRDEMIAQVLSEYHLFLNKQSKK